MTTIRTNHIVLHTDQFDLSQLLGKYQIARYIIPRPRFAFGNGIIYRNEEGRLKYTDKAYAMLQNLFKEQLERPYYYNSPNLTVLVMFGKDEQVPLLEVAFLENESINPTILSESEVNDIVFKQTSNGYSQLHSLLKLMLAKFHFDYDRQHLMCQGKFFVFGKKVFKKPSHIVALEISLKDDYKRNRDDDSNKEYAITFESTCFLERSQGFENLPEDVIASRYYYEQVTDNGELNYLRQIKRNSVKSYAGISYVEVNTLLRRSLQQAIPRAKLAWFDAYRPFTSRMPILYTFQNLFVKFLNEWGFTASIKTKTFEQYRPRTENSDLRIDLLSRINVVDIRENKKGVSSEQYISFLKNSVPFLEDSYNKKRKGRHAFNYEFQLIEEKDIDENIPTLVLYDCEKEAFNLDAGTDGVPIGLLARLNRQDAKHTFYQRHSTLVKHTLNVNPNSVDDFTDAQRYLTYDTLTCQLVESVSTDKKVPKTTWKFNHADYKHRLQVVFSELFKKYFLAKGWSVDDPENYLPCFSTYGSLLKKLLFIYNFQFDKFNKCRMLMHCRNGKFEFIDLAKDPQEGNYLLASVGSSLAELKKFYNEKYTKDKEGDIDQAAFIVGPNLCLEVERLDEVILYDFWTIQAEKRYGKDLVYHQYLWYCSMDNTYFVGSPHSFNRQQPQPNAFHLYRIHQHRYDDQFDMALLYEAMAVEFVRNKQYTVLPYFFDFIRLVKE